MTDISLFDYSLPENLIAQYPAAERDASRLLVVNRVGAATEDRLFSDLPEYLRAGDVLVFNDSRVIKARLIGEKTETGARVEIFLIKRMDGMDGTDEMYGNKAGGELWEALARPAKRLKAGDHIIFGKELICKIEGKTGDGSVLVRFLYDGILMDVLECLGRVPLPPYIRREDKEMDAERYQTVYAKTPGSAAAPTAGLHFTDGLLDRLRAMGVETVFVTLHVGLGTFRPVQTDIIEEHNMHSERYHIDAETWRRINRAKADGRRIICVGTTSVRAIESAAGKIRETGSNPDSGVSGDTDIFFYPGGREFRMTDGLITNFHLPRSTLLMLVCAFYDREKMLAIYKEAVQKKYRFFSYGDAMLIL